MLFLRFLFFAISAIFVAVAVGLVIYDVFLAFELGGCCVRTSVRLEKVRKGTRARLPSRPHRQRRLWAQFNLQ